MSTQLTLAARLALDSQQWGRGLAQSRTQTRSFVSGVKREFADLKGFMSTTAGKITSLAGGITLASAVADSARMDKALTRIGQTAGASQVQVAGLRGELFRMAGETGQSVTDLRAGFDKLVAGGLTFAEALPTLNAINLSMAVTGAQSETLADTLGVASTAFQFDLSNPGAALTLIDKMTIAGRQGKAELESLGAIFSRVGVNAKDAGFSFEQTLSFIEGLSLIEGNPERLATLADSTTRLFTNDSYFRQAQKATGVQFFKEDGSRSDPFTAFTELKALTDQLATEKERSRFLSTAFKGADLDLIKGMRIILTGDTLERMVANTAGIHAAGGVTENDIAGSIANAIDQTGRLKARLAEAADTFAQKLNAPYAAGISKLLDPKDKGGFDLSGGQLLAGGAGALGLAFLGRKLPGKLGALLGGSAGLGAGVAVGTALEQAGAATPVYIVGAAPGLFSGAGGGLGAGTLAGAAAGGGLGRKIGTRALLGRGALALGGASVSGLAGAGALGAGALGAGALAAGGIGYGIGTGISSLANRTDVGRELLGKVGADIAKALALLGNDNARSAIESNRKLELSILLDDVRSRVDGVRLNGRDATATVGIGRRGTPDLGRMMRSPGVF